MFLDMTASPIQIFTESTLSSAVDSGVVFNSVHFSVDSEGQSRPSNIYSQQARNVERVFSELNAGTVIAVDQSNKLSEALQSFKFIEDRSFDVAVSKPDTSELEEIFIALDDFNFDEQDCFSDPEGNSCDAFINPQNEVSVFPIFDSLLNLDDYSLFSLSSDSFDNQVGTSSLTSARRIPFGSQDESVDMTIGENSVSYTHLTLPTIYSV